MALTLADVLTEHWTHYARTHRHTLCAAHYRAVQHVLTCRTPAFGGRLYQCQSCSKPHFAYHSCNHRSCPQCGSLDQHLWSAKQEAKLLPATTYHMVTFTLPAELRTLCQQHPKDLYNLLLTQSATALKNIIHTKTHGATTGFISVLHTWGRQLQHHPHIHCIVPATAYNPKTQHITQTNKNNTFLIHHRPLAAHFRNLIRTALQDHHPHIYNQLNANQHRSLSTRTQWNVQLQPVGKGKTALRYLARYVKRSGFTNQRLIGYTPDKQHILLRWTNSTNGKQSILKLSPHELIRRWLLHVLPKGMMSIRHYGYLSSAAKKTRLTIRALLGSLEEPNIELPDKGNFCCPHCGGTLQFLRELPRLTPYRGPPAPA